MKARNKPEDYPLYCSLGLESLAVDKEMFDSQVNPLPLIITESFSDLATVARFYIHNYFEFVDEVFETLIFKNLTQEDAEEILDDIVYRYVTQSLILMVNGMSGEGPRDYIFDRLREAIVVFIYRINKSLIDEGVSYLEGVLPYDLKIWQNEELIVLTRRSFEDHLAIVVSNSFSDISRSI